MQFQIKSIIIHLKNFEKLEIELENPNTAVRKLYEKVERLSFSYRQIFDKNKTSMNLWLPLFKPTMYNLNLSSGGIFNVIDENVRYGYINLKFVDYGATDYSDLNDMIFFKLSDDKIISFSNLITLVKLSFDYTLRHGNKAYKLNTNKSYDFFVSFYNTLQGEEILFELT